MLVATGCVMEAKGVNLKDNLGRNYVMGTID